MTSDELDGPVEIYFKENSIPSIHRGYLTDEYKAKLKAREARIETAARELYIPVRGFEGLYEVSNFGNVRSVVGGKRQGKVLKGGKRFRNYLSVSLCKDGVYKSYLVHRLVAEAFISNPGNRATVNHKDNDQTNNNISNLEWATHSENELHAHTKGKVVWNKGRTGFHANVSRAEAVRIAHLKNNPVADDSGGSDG